MTLFSYVLRYDFGAAPNPFGGICTLVICKPRVRRAAQIGDWIVGLGSANTPLGDLSSNVIYAMRVSRVMTMAEYDQYCQKELSIKLPQWNGTECERRVDDCIYDFADPTNPILRTSVHDEGNRATDLGGISALLSDHYYYFGDKAPVLPNELRVIMHRHPGHKSHANDPYRQQFIEWVESQGHETNRVLGNPLLWNEICEPNMEEARTRCACAHKQDDEDDMKYEASHSS
jgi:hypothetical protein